MPGPELRAYLAQRLATHPTVHSMAALSRASGVSQRTLTNWFSDTYQPTADTMARLASALGVKAGELWAVYNGDVTPRVGLEQEIAELLNQAFERGFEAGFRSGRAERRG